MLYVGCSFCCNVGPLLCAGSFPPHPVMPAIQGPMGALCPYCGPLLPWFGCGRCGSRQMMFFPATQSFFAPHTVPQFMPGAMPSLAPVIQAAPGLNGNQLNSLFGKTIAEFCTSFSGQLGQDLAGALSGWVQGGVEGAWQ